MKLVGDGKTDEDDYVMWWVYNGIAHRLQNFSDDKHWVETRVPELRTHERTACGRDVVYDNIPGKPYNIKCGACERVVIMRELAE